MQIIRRTHLQASSIKLQLTVGSDPELGKGTMPLDQAHMNHERRGHERRAMHMSCAFNEPLDESRFLCWSYSPHRFERPKNPFNTLSPRNLECSSRGTLGNEFSSFTTTRGSRASVQTEGGRESVDPHGFLRGAGPYIYIQTPSSPSKVLDTNACMIYMFKKSILESRVLKMERLPLETACPSGSRRCPCCREECVGKPLLDATSQVSIQCTSFEHLGVLGTYPRGLVRRV